MKKYIYILLFITCAFKAHSHKSHYQGIIKIEMDVIRNGEIIGYSNYFFEHEDEKMTVKNYTNLTNTDKQYQSSFVGFLG